MKRIPRQTGFISSRGHAVKDVAEEIAAHIAQVDE